MSCILQVKIGNQSFSNKFIPQELFTVMMSRYTNILSHILMQCAHAHTIKLHHILYTRCILWLIVKG